MRLELPSSWSGWLLASQLHNEYALRADMLWLQCDESRCAEDSRNRLLATDSKDSGMNVKPFP